MAPEERPRHRAVASLLGAPGTLVAARANAPLLLDDASSVWIVETGGVDVFAVPVEEGAPAGSRRFLFQAEAGSALLGFGGQADSRLRLLAVGFPDTQLRRFAWADLETALADASRQAEAVGLVERWLAYLGQAILPVPACDVSGSLALGDAPIQLAAGQVVVASATVWLGVTAGAAMLRGRPEARIDVSSGLAPVPAGATLCVDEALTATTLGTAAVFATGGLAPGVQAYTARILNAVAADIAAEVEAERARFEAAQAGDVLAMQQAMAAVASVLAAPGPSQVVAPAADRTELIYQACAALGRASVIAFERPPRSLQALAERDPVAAIAAASRVRYRRVILPDGWWRGDHGPILAFRKPAELAPAVTAAPGADEIHPTEARLHSTDPNTAPGAAILDMSRPVALVPRGAGGYDIVDPADATRVRASAQPAADLQDAAITFYRPFAAHAISVRELLAFGLRQTRRDLWRIGGWGALVALLSLVVPVFTGMLFGDVIPAGNLRELAQIGIGLLVAALAGALLMLGQNMAILRLTGRVSYDLQAAVWDRLLALPVPFYRQFTAGDLVGRAIGIEAIRQILSGVTVSSLLGLAFSIFSLALLFAYSVTLALLALALIAVLTLVTATLGLLQVRASRRMYRLQGAIYGILYQYLQSVDKLRIAGAEMRAFARWAQQFREQKAAGFQAGLAANGLTTVNAVFGPVASAILYLAVAGNIDAQLQPGGFLAFAAAFGQFVAATMQVNYSLIAILSIVPLYERLEPILAALPETDATKRDPGILTGRVQIDHIHFRYSSDGPLVLDDVSMSFEPGEFVAIVGPSGSGKSSLLRLLLGFEQPTAGTILYDGQDLAQVDVRRVRRQIGVVLQDGKPMAGDIFHNIIGASQLGLDEAWAAAAAAGIDDDIRRMPMGMFTYVPEGGGSFSGGQLQRILLARALVGRPRLLLMDESTSALDNVTQAHVIQSLKATRATVIMVAERLSTIQGADRIYVLDRGKLVESGRFEDLMKLNGTFAALARRQLV